MVLFSNSLTSSWPPSTTTTATAPLITVMHSNPIVSSTISVESTSSPSPARLTTIPWWGTKPYLEEAIAFDLNPYATDMGEPYYVYSRKELEDQSLYSRCGLSWRTSFFQWISTAVESSTLLDQFTCFKTATHNPAWDCETADKEWELMTTFYSEARAFPFTASPPCCGGCTFTAGSVQVYHWPLATTSPLVSILVNSQGFKL